MLPFDIQASRISVAWLPCLPAGVNGPGHLALQRSPPNSCRVSKACCVSKLYLVNIRLSVEPVAQPSQTAGHLSLCLANALSPLCITESWLVLGLLFSSPMTHCSQILCFLHNHLVFTTSWLLFIIFMFLPPPLAFSFSLFSLSFSFSCSMTSYPPVFLRPSFSLTFHPEPVLELVQYNVTASPSRPVSPPPSPPHWLLSPPVLHGGSATNCPENQMKGQPPLAM